MNPIKHTLITGLMSLFLSSILWAQSFDANRMNRDIRIMENILAEMFKTQIKTPQESSVSTTSRSFIYLNTSSSGSVQGTYVPEYGTIFMIPKKNSRNIVIRRNSGEEASVVFQYKGNKGEADRAIDRESVIDRITEFLQDYASTIGQLKGEEKVMVIYGTNQESNSLYRVFRYSDDNEEASKEKELPIISVSVKAKDLQDYRSGKINEKTLKDRMAISESEDKERLDLKVMGNIFKTALTEDEDQQYHLINSQSLSYLYLDNFGALYNLNLHRGHDLGSMRSGFFRVQELSDASPKESTSKQAEIKIKEIKSNLEKEQEELTETLKKEYEKLLDRTKEFLVDYGRTLNSLANDQHLLVTMNINESIDSIPERVDFQLQKSVLSELDQGKISRTDAMNAVTITEY